MIRKNILFRPFELFDSYMLNAYKNLWEDSWWNTLVNMNSYRTYLLIELDIYI